MKFGADFHRHIIPEWRVNYVDYNLLKGLIKSLSFSGRVEVRSLLAPEQLLT